ncbi:MAG: XdhC family protein [Hyphomicrobiales bacterium]
MEKALLANINTARANRRAVILVRDLKSGVGRLILPDTLTDDDPLAQAAKTRFRSGKSGREMIGEQEFFLNVDLPAPRIVVIGAVHISQALVPMVRECGFDLSIIDPRTAFATKERFPSVNLQAEWPQDVLTSDMIDSYTALVAVTHDPKIDDFALETALQSGCFYIGALGSRKTHKARVDRLKSKGFSEDLIARIDAPIGLDIGAASPAEIAVAILGQIISALRKGDDA